MIIYRATNKINGKMYIGQTIQPLKLRIKNHLRSTCLSHFKKALLKNGIENFEWIVLYETDNKEDLNDNEIYFIKLFNSLENGYNMTEGGEGSYGFKHTEESKRIISEKAKLRGGHPHTEEHKKYMSDVMKGKNKNFGEDNNFYGKKHKDDSKIKMSNAKKGVKLSEEHKDKINCKGRKLSDETKEKIRQSNIKTWVIRHEKNILNNA